MDFTNRNQQTNGRPATAFPAASSEAEHKPKSDRTIGSALGGDNKNKWMRWGGGVLVILVAILIAAALALFIMAKPASQEHFVDDNRLQAVFLTNDQVYFGSVSEINDKYLVLNNIYYLQSAAENANKTTDGNISLVKLGCELHKPQDQMVISQNQVSFWENLQDDGQVAKAVAQYEKANPNGQTCNDSEASGNPVQGSTENQDSATPNTTTPPTTNTQNSDTDATKPTDNQ